MKDQLKKEFIGLWLEVIESKNKNLVGIKGRVIDETKNMLVIETEKGRKKIIKNACKFALSQNHDNRIIINGKEITKRAEDRISIKDY